MSFFEEVAGLWAGSERMMLEPGEPPVEAEAELDMRPLLGGKALSSDYVQKVAGEVSMRCHSLFRFSGEDGAVEMIWHGEGQPEQRFAGTLNGPVLTLQPAEGEGPSIVQDFSQPGLFSSKSVMKMPDGEEIELFAGEYRRQDR